MVNPFSGGIVHTAMAGSSPSAHSDLYVSLDCDCSPNPIMPGSNKKGYWNNGDRNRGNNNPGNWRQRYDDSATSKLAKVVNDGCVSAVSETVSGGMRSVAQNWWDQLTREGKTKNKCKRHRDSSSSLSSSGNTWNSSAYEMDKKKQTRSNTELNDEEDKYKTNPRKIARRKTRSQQRTTIRDGRVLQSPPILAMKNKCRVQR